MRKIILPKVDEANAWSMFSLGVFGGLYGASLISFPGMIATLGATLLFSSGRAEQLHLKNRRLFIFLQIIAVWTGLTVVNDVASSVRSGLNQDLFWWLLILSEVIYVVLYNRYYKQAASSLSRPIAE